MSMLAASYDDDGVPYDPDEDKVPESSLHRSVNVLIEVALAHVLGGSRCVHANMNWYPLDGASALCPDVMVFDRPVVEFGAKSYRQAEDQPIPIAVIEVPSDSDTVPAFGLKRSRYRRLGTTLYVVEVTGELGVTRYSPDADEARGWLGRPCPELGGLVFQVDGDKLAVWLPGGLTASSAEGLIASVAAAAEARADTAEARAARLAAQLRAAGIEPTA